MWMVKQVREGCIGCTSLVLFGLLFLQSGAVGQQDPTQVISWNDLGMHCIDPSFSTFALLPPFNTVNSQLIVNGNLRTTSGGYLVTYEGIADPAGSINTTSIGKTDFWDHVLDLFGVALPLDVGLAGNAMPGLANVPQPTHFDTTWHWFQAEGIPITPLDDGLHKNPYPLLKIVARDSGGQVVSSTVTVAPNSSELQCTLCHASGGSPFAAPAAGWVYDPDPMKDDRLNILRLHDEREKDNPTFTAALATVGYNPAGLFATAHTDGIAVLCSRCHGSNALPGSGIPGVLPMTQAMHGLHGGVIDPGGTVLDQETSRASCYTCHPGFDTQCLRGAMGKAIGPDGDFAMQCQSCHGNFGSVADSSRVGWLDQPACQNCHTGTATLNSGAIRFPSVFDAGGNLRQPASAVFATTPDVPAQGFSLYRFSSGHGGMQCSACHGSPHAIYPTDFPNDNVQMEQLQGHAGTLSDCSACHGQLEDTEMVGPHGMHPQTQEWASGKHGDIAEQMGTTFCQDCHGIDYNGTVLSYVQDDRTFTTQFGVKSFWRGYQVGCYECHDGPSDDHVSPNHRPVVTDRFLTTPTDVPVASTLAGTDSDGDPLTFRIVSQPAHGTVAFDGFVATYAARDGFEGTDSYTYAASDTKTNSNLGTVTVGVTAPLCAGAVETYGFGCPGSGGFLPALAATGCAAPGELMTVSLREGLGGSVALMFLGTGRTALPLPGGCTLRVTPALRLLPVLPLAGQGAGNGSLDLGFQVPPGFGGITLTMQALVFDPGAAGKWAATNGLELRFSP